MFSRIVRRIHLYLALILGPWVLMYAVSTFVMNHRVWFRGEIPAPPKWETASQGTYDGEFAANATRAEMAAQILASLGLDGAHQVSLNNGRLVIVRHDPFRPVRITYATADRGLLVERQAADAAAFLERMHRRRGYQHAYVTDDLWAFSVDFFILVMVFWVLSGLWMWWEMKMTRAWGIASLAADAALFALFLGVL